MEFCHNGEIAGKSKFTCRTLLNGLTDPCGVVCFKETKKLNPFSLSDSLMLKYKVDVKMKKITRIRKYEGVLQIDESFFAIK